MMQTMIGFLRHQQILMQQHKQQMIDFVQIMVYKPLLLVVARGMVRLVACSRLRVIVPWALLMWTLVFVL